MFNGKIKGKVGFQKKRVLPKDQVIKSFIGTFDWGSFSPHTIEKEAEHMAQFVDNMQEDAADYLAQMEKNRAGGNKDVLETEILETSNITEAKQETRGKEKTAPR
jgi:hypothetical protein